jgi:hypothetical protein
MRHRIALSIAALALVSACADGSGGPGALLGPSYVAGNPPPPAFTGAIGGFFRSSPVDERRASTLGGLSLSVSTTGNNPPAGVFRFSLAPVEYNADQSLTSFWMNFPYQPLPRALQGLIPPLPRGHIVYKNGQSTGSGIILARDDANGGWWLIHLNQFTQPYNVFLPSCQNTNWVDCLTLDAPVFAIFYRVIEDVEGQKRFETYPSITSQLNFATGF